ncbi:MAG: hypothetical protein K9G69_05840 [Candidatus Nanopelagicales bacterium]|nr:hypothetical protein [Candidatus Nanopelagicales bacterium]
MSIVITRHGEKPSDSGKPHGINVEGEHDPHSLSVRGWTRAGALAGLFSLVPQPQYPGVSTPARIFATEPSHEAHSTREYDTAHPTARRLGLDVNSTYKHGQEAELAAELMASDSAALVVWHHGAIPHVLQHFPLSNAHQVPAEWPEDRFDLLWVLTRDSGADTWTWSAVDQALLDGDAL